MHNAFTFALFTSYFGILTSTFCLYLSATAD
jgi:hypothetical protein